MFLTRFFAVLTLVAAGCLNALADDSTDSIKSALEYQLENYPASQYRDVYKNFMQDFFGPGHILADTTAAGNYLRRELAEKGAFEGPLYEKTGFNGNFYRVNLSLVRDRKIPYDIFFNAFVDSVRGIVPPSADDWMKQWKEIDMVINQLGLHFENEETDRRELAEQFDKGDFVVHHSQRFNETVNFHYRIISRDNFNRFILPYIE